MAGFRAMLNTKTLRFKLLFGFIAVIVPLAVTLFLLNLYAMKVVREEVSQSTANLLSLHVSQIDNSLEKAGQYLLRLISSDFYYSDLIGLTLYKQDSSDYFLAKQRIFNSFQEEINTSSYLPVDTFFAYSAKYKDLFATQISYASSQKINGMLSKLVLDQKVTGTHSWQMVTQDSRPYLLRIERFHPDVYVGALIPADSLMKPLQKVNLGQSRQAFLISRSGQPLSETSLDQAGLQEMLRKFPNQSGQYRTFSNPADGKKYLAVGSPVHNAPMTLAVIIPETDLLQNLPYFQRGLILIPIGIVALLIVFSFVLKQVLLKPMNFLIRGMRRTAQGDFTIRLEEGATEEFRFLNHTFNRMVSQIRQLKIHVYEEMLKTQDAEFKHLQAQINPHFYLNSLNIIYSLSKLKRNELVEKMAEHLADYFRFITRANRQYITLEEETEHIRNYLEIQKLRFPNKLTYEMTVPEPYRSRSVLPLMIQPFVENSVVHGMRKGRHVFHIRIEARPFHQDPGIMEIVIADNGSGFPDETLERLRSGLNADPASAKSLGILNVQNRLKLKYGDEVSILFQNRTDSEDGRPVQGAEVILRIPADWNEEDGQDV